METYGKQNIFLKLLKLFQSKKWYISNYFIGQHKKDINNMCGG